MGSPEAIRHPPRDVIPSAGTVTRIYVSMVSLKWSDVLSTLLPGAVALFAVAPYFPLLQRQFDRPDGINAGAGVVLLMAAALAGGVLEAVTRIGWERYCLTKLCPSHDALSQLRPDNLDAYERGVQSSYKYATFYANYSWAAILLILTRSTHGQLFTVGTLMLVTMVMILLYASYIQWTYYVNYLKKVFPAKPQVIRSE
jgi:predicted PurR-regulated permease PerM